jgi:crossover junction endodeoxyribonuclease RuvC
MRVLGVDPGLTRCGVGVVDGGAGRRCALVHVQVVRTPPEAPLGERLLAVSDAITEAIALFAPEVLAVERVFSQHNVRSVMGTAQASAMAIAAGARAELPVALHTPSEVKAAVTGSGRADKAQVTTMVTRILGLAEAPRPADAADALAIAICHLWRAPLTARLEQALATGRAARAGTPPRGVRAGLGKAAGGAGR